MTVYSEEQLPIPVGRGLDLYNHPANVEDGFSVEIENFIAKGDRLVSREGFTPADDVDTRTAINYGASYSARAIRLPPTNNASWPIAIQTIGSTNWMFREFDRTAYYNTTGDSLVSFSTFGAIVGACTYLDRFYVCQSGGTISGGGIKRVTNWNWSAGTVTLTDIDTDIDDADGMILFKDRLWAWDDDIIYYTDVPASPGAYPETWDAAANFLVVGAEAGTARIYNIVPLHNRLIIFTSSGVYTLNAGGTPASWTLTKIDNTVCVNTYSCATVIENLVYFVDINGVYVTDGFDIKPIDSSINPIFNELNSAIYSIYKIFPFNNGILLAKTNLGQSGSSPRIVGLELYYTRTDFIAWSKFTFANTSTVRDLIGAFDDLEWHGSYRGQNFITLGHSTSLASTTTGEVLEYGGYQDTLRELSAAAQTVSVTGFCRSKILRGSLFEQKRGKYAYLNLSGNGSLPDTWNIYYRWKTEALEPTQVNITSAVGSDVESMQKIGMDLMFRNVQLTVGFTLDSGITEYTYLGAGIIMHTNRREPRRES